MTDSVASELASLRDERQGAIRWLSEYDQRVTHWGDWKKRIGDVDAVARGDWHVVFPDSTSETDRPKVSNLVDMVLKDRPKLAASVIPTLRCDPPNEDAKARSEKRERIASHYMKLNKVGLMLFRFYQDLLSAGANFKVVLPDFESKYPCIRRIDPRHALPDKAYSPDRGIGNLIVAYKANLSELEKLYKNQEGEFAELRSRKRKDSDLVDVIEYYDASECIKVAWIPGSSRYGMTLGKPMPNLLKRVPVACAALPTFDGQFRGELDQVLSVLEHENRLTTLLLDEAINWIYAPIVEYDIENWEQFGSGAVLHKRSPQGEIRRAPPANSNPQIFATLGQLRGAAREGAFYPEARAGNIEQNIASAAFVSSIVGQLSTAVAADQRIEAASWEEVLSLCFETDEKWFGDEKKFISGSVNAARFSESYTPSKAIKGDYNIRVEYGGAAGADQFQYEIRLLQQAGNGLISKRRARENLSSVVDVLEEEKLIDLEQLKAAGLAFIQTAAANGDFSPAATYLEALDRGDNPLLVLSQFAQAQAAPAPQLPAAALAGTEAMNEAGALMRGGQAPVPGGGPENVPGVGALPPLADLLVS